MEEIAAAVVFPEIIGIMIMAAPMKREDSKTIRASSFLMIAPWKYFFFLGLRRSVLRSWISLMPKTMRQAGKLRMSSVRSAAGPGNIDCAKKG